MSQFTTALSQRVDTSKAYVPEIQLFITPKQTSAITKKYTINAANPWEKEPTTPALAYGTVPTPALTAPPGVYNNTQPAYNTQPVYQQPQTPYPAAGGALPQRPPPVQPQNIHQPPAQYLPQQHVPQQPIPQHVPQQYVPQQPIPQHVPQQYVPQQPVPQQQNQAYVPHPGNPFANPVSNPANPFAGAPPARPVPAQTKPQARAQWDFNSQNPDELSFKAGEIIIIHEQAGDWWRGEIRGRTGLLPANYVQLC